MEIKNIRFEQELVCLSEEMRMLTWMDGVTREDWMRNECVRESVDVDKIRENNRLKRFERVKRRRNRKL